MLYYGEFGVYFERVSSANFTHRPS